MANKLVNVLALLSVAALGVSFGPAPVNAIQVAGHHVQRGDHHVVAKKRRGASNKRCKQRPTSSILSSSSVASSTSAADPKTSSSSSTPEPTPTPTPTPTPSSSPAAKPTSSRPPATTSTPPPAETSSSPPVTGGGGKAGLAWPNGDYIDIKPWVGNNVGYIYTWDSWIPPSATKAGLKGLPMLWGGAGDKITKFHKEVPQGYKGLVAGFNEPNESGQSNMSPEWAAQLWKEHIEPLRNGGAKTICPATSSNPNGKVWVDKFLQVCGGGCTCDYHAVHYYDTSIEGFKKYVQDWIDHFGKKVFVTEFACQNFNGGAQCSPEEVKTFWRSVIGWMKENDDVVAYFGFGAMHDMYNVNYDNRMMLDNGKPNAFGQAYVDGY